MKLTKNVALLVSLLMLCIALLPSASLAEAQPVPTDLRGLVTEIVEGGFLMEDVNLGTVLLNVDPETVLEGVLAEQPLKKGMYVLAKCNGLFTRSNPPQTHADRLGCYPLEGTVSEMLDNGILLTDDPIFGEVIVNLTDAMPHVFLGVPITVYYDGAMAMSLPGRVTARHVVVPVVTGTVKELSKNSFRLETSEGETYTIDVSSKTLLPSSWFDETLKGKKVIVYHSGSAHNSGVLSALEVMDPDRIVDENEPLDGMLEEDLILTETPAPSDTETAVPTEVPPSSETGTEAPTETPTFTEPNSPEETSDSTQAPDEAANPANDS